MDDQIGDFKGVIDAIVLVLNGFAIIALLAAGSIPAWKAARQDPIESLSYE